MLKQQKLSQVSEICHQFWVTVRRRVGVRVEVRIGVEIFCKNSGYHIFNSCILFFVLRDVSSFCDSLPRYLKLRTGTSLKFLLHQKLSIEISGVVLGDTVVTREDNNEKLPLGEKLPKSDATVVNMIRAS